jgi:hypothetical protein
VRSEVTAPLFDILKGVQNTLLDDAALQKRPEILIYSDVNSGFSPLLRLASSMLGCFAESSYSIASKLDKKPT